MTYYTRSINPQPTQRVGSAELKAEFSSVQTGFESAETADGKAVRAPEAIPTLPNAISRALKILSFDASGNPATSFSAAELSALVLAAETAAGATKWISGTTYAQGDVTWSPIDYQSYRRKTAGAGTTDPSADSTNWERLRAGSGLILLASYDAAGAATVDIEALSSSYDDYVIEFSNVVLSAINGPLVRVKKSGSYVTGSTYNVLIGRNDGSSWSQSLSIGTTSASIGNVSGATWAGQIRITRANSTSGQILRVDYSGLSSSGGNVGTTSATETTAAAIQGIRVYVSSGTFTAGTFRIYGVAK